VPNAVLLIGRLALAAVFVVAGAAKLADRAGSRRAPLEFGVPPALAGPVALLLPLAELAIAVALVVPETAAYGALGAAVLLLAFSVAIAVNLAWGRSPDCHCFGQLHSSPAGPGTLVRNLTLLAGAALVAGFGWDDAGPSPVAWLSDLSDTALVTIGAGVLVAGLVGAGVLLAIHLLRAYGRLLVRLEELEARLGGGGMPALDVEHHQPGPGLSPGSEAPSFKLESVEGGTVTLDDLLEPARPLLLVFADPDCGPCRALMPDVAGWQGELADDLTVAVVSGGGAEESRKHARRHRLDRVLLQNDAAVAMSFEAYGTPVAVLVAADGKVVAPVAQGADAIGELVDRALAPPAGPEPSGLPVGVQSPDLELPTLDGGRLAVRDLRGQDTLLVFWNPGCGFCQAMRDELKAWEESHNGEPPRLVVISSGERDATAAEGFSSVVLLDESHEAGNAFQAGGTPMAVLLDAEGRVASPVAAGPEAVLSLAEDGRKAAALVTTPQLRKQPPPPTGSGGWANRHPGLSD
jgi:peroxiredoxin